MSELLPDAQDCTAGGPCLQMSVAGNWPNSDIVIPIQVTLLSNLQKVTRLRGLGAEMVRGDLKDRSSLE